ncbi:hypothetical protein A2U01_0016749, partial [Trifolium medium]|nr:hypothetical protein [Trifolium medium]
RNKQAWRFTSQPDTLVAKIYKARWKVGDGSKINVMKEPWLRGEGELRISSPQEQAVVVERIMKVPLLGDVTKDELVWQEEQNGAVYQHTFVSGHALSNIQQSVHYVQIFTKMIGTSC